MTAWPDEAIATTPQSRPNRRTVNPCSVRATMAVLRIAVIDRSSACGGWPYGNRRCGRDSIAATNRLARRRTRPPAERTLHLAETVHVGLADGQRLLAVLEANRH